MTRVFEILKSYGAQTIGTSKIILDPTKIKTLGNLRGILLECSVTTTVGTGSYKADSGEGLGTNVLRFFKKIEIIDRSGNKLFDGESLEILPFLLESGLVNELDPDLDFYRGSNFSLGITNITADVSAKTYYVWIPLTVSLERLGGTSQLNIHLSTLSDLFATVGTASASITLKVYGVYTDEPVSTMRWVVLRTANSYSTDKNVAEDFTVRDKPIISAVFTSGSLTALSFPAELNKTRINTITVSRAGNLEIDEMPIDVLNEFSKLRYRSSVKPSAIVFLFANGIVINDQTVIKFKPNASIQPVFYLTYLE